MSKTTEEHTNVIGWQGLALEVPELWEPHSLSGTRARGALQLDDGDAIRLRCSWRELRRPPDLLAEADAYLERLKREARKKKVDFSAKQDIRLSLPPDRVATCFSWRAEAFVYAMLAYCQECRRLSSLYVFGQPGRSVERDARQVFAAYRCHSEDDRECWSVFGLCSVVPSGWELVRSELRAGQVSLRLTRRREELALARVALAESILRRKKFVRWAEEYYGKELRSYHWRGERTEYRGHIALEIQGKERIRGPLVQLFRKPKTLRVRAWYCGELDKIYALWYVGGEPESFDELVAGLACHRSEAGPMVSAASPGGQEGGEVGGDGQR